MPPPQQQERPPEIPHPQSTEEDAVLIRQLYGHVPTEEIVRIVDGLRVERQRQGENVNPVGTTSQASKQLRLDISQEALLSEEQDASGSGDLHSSMSIEQVTPPPSMNQDAPPPRYSRVIEDGHDTESL
jgi:hypothetical protein